MVFGIEPGLLVGAIALGAVHGIEPGHGWPVAASYALDQTNKWVYGVAASLIIGFGHLLSSIAMVAVFFSAKSYFDLAAVDEPIHLTETVVIGGPVSLAAGVLLIGLGIREYRNRHSHSHHGHDSGHEHEHDSGHEHEHDSGHEHEHDSGHEHEHDSGHEHEHDSGHEHEHAGTGESRWTHLKRVLPFVGTHSDTATDDPAERGLWGIAWFAFLLGFAHEEEFEIIALCAGSNACLELMSAYALTVIAGIVALTTLLIAGYQYFEERVEQYTQYLPVVSAAVLVVMGVGFVGNVF